MKIKRTKSEFIFDTVNGILLVLLCIVMLYPFIHVTAVAFSTQAEAIRPGLHLYPREVDFSALEQVLSAPEIWQAYGNTIFRTVVGTILSVVCTGMGAYAISKP